MYATNCTFFSFQFGQWKAFPNHALVLFPVHARFSSYLFFSERLPQAKRQCSLVCFASGYACIWQSWLLGASLVFFCRFLFSPRSCWIGEICRFRCSKERGGGGGRVLWQLGQLTSTLPFRLNPPSLPPPSEQLHSIALQTQQAKGMVPLRLYKSAVWKWYSDCGVLYISTFSQTAR